MGAEHKKRVNEGGYYGCILYLYMKIEEGNLLKLVIRKRKEGGGKKVERVNLRYIVKTYVDITIYLTVQKILKT
jgi:hypothetical protein